MGIYNILTGHVSPTLHAPIGTPVAGISLFLLLRAFASGSSALTGVEAISNAIRTLKILRQTMLQNIACNGCITCCVIFRNCILAYYYGVTPSKEVTVVSQIAEQTFGRNFMYYFIQGTTALILILAANTGYSAFPLLAVNLQKINSYRECLRLEETA